jgi:hypothetical protein
MRLKGGYSRLSKLQKLVLKDGVFFHVTVPNGALLPYAMVDFYSGGNSTQIPFWHPVPTYRGTYNILSACLVTIGLCVWSALHLNVPKYGTTSRQWWRKVKWLFVGLFAPELVAWTAGRLDGWTAFRQHRAARKLYICIRAKLGQDLQMDLVTDRPRFSALASENGMILTPTPM